MKAAIFRLSSYTYYRSVHASSLCGPVEMVQIVEHGTSTYVNTET